MLSLLLGVLCLMITTVRENAFLISSDVSKVCGGLQFTARVCALGCSSRLVCARGCNSRLD